MSRRKNPKKRDHSYAGKSSLAQKHSIYLFMQDTTLPNPLVVIRETEKRRATKLDEHTIRKHAMQLYVFHSFLSQINIVYMVLNHDPKS
ncbi:unnamed protein product [Sphenostylis stenocarpa]|uniref:Uncharacterized protein n=1 Tax=Sphenostylis stenocarpa TaxID=92480 RepID=A0AA86T8F5_9FABA|nr:unnamed protein product [Sphenostylis stenocarpa]